MKSKGMILLVDDEKDLVDLLKPQLEDFDYTVHTALSGQQALEIAGSSRIDIMLVDIRMPGMDGIETK